MTTAKQDLIDTVASDLDAWVQLLLTDPEAVLSEVLGAVSLSDLYTARQLLTLYDPDGKKRVTMNGLARALKRNGASLVGNTQHVTPTSLGNLRLYAIKNADRWVHAKPKELQQYYDARFARPSAPPVKF